MSRDQDHPHGCGHSHEDDDVHGPEALPGPSQAGSVILDIGPGVGAAVVRASLDMNGVEIEYRVAGEQWSEKHMAVRERQGTGEAQYAAIFSPLTQGIYEFRVRGSGRPEPDLVVSVQEASVTSALWPDVR